MPKILGIDYGEKKIGLAVADGTVRIAHPHSVIASGDKAVGEIARIINDEGIAAAVVGLPRSLSGEEGPQAAAVRRFAEELMKVTDIEIVFQDERLSSREAENILIRMDISRGRRREIADAHQAAIILQVYLDSTGDG